MVKVKKQIKLPKTTAKVSEVVLASKRKSAKGSKNKVSTITARATTDTLKKVAPASKKQMKTSKATNTKQSKNKKVLKAEKATRQLYVTGFSEKIDSSAVQSHFTKYGAVRAVTLIKGRKSSNGHAYAIVLYEKVESLQEATKQAKHTIEGRDVKIQLAGERRFTYIDNELFVYGLNRTTIRKCLEEYFSKFGGLSRLNMPYIHHKSLNKGVAFVAFREESDMKKVLEQKEHKVDGAVVHVNKKTENNGVPSINGKTKKVKKVKAMEVEEATKEEEQEEEQDDEEVAEEEEVGEEGDDDDAEMETAEGSDDEVEGDE